MKKTNKFLNTILSIFFLAIVMGSLCFNIYELINNKNGATTTLLLLLTAVCYILALVYCLKGYKKRSAIYYKLFLIVYTIMAALNLYVLVSDQNKKILLIVIAILTLLFRGTLGFIEDLGKKVSLSLACALLVLTIILAIYFVATNSNNAISFIGFITLDMILLFMVYAKYEDKTNRNTN